MTTPELNFIILKINETDCANLSRDETIGVFLTAKDPIVIKVRRRHPQDGINSWYLFDEEWMNLLKCKSRSISDKSEYVNVECQTDLTYEYSCNQFDSVVKNLNDDDNYQGLNDTDGVFNNCFVPGIDIEEITLKKTRSDEKLGLTVSYSSVNSSASVSASDDDEEDINDVLDRNENKENGCGNIFICHIQQDSIAARDGRLREGDQIIQINGRDISNKGETESLFAENKNAITLLVSRCICTTSFHQDEELLDSAIYCDDKDQNTGISLSLDCEASTYSSKSSLRSFSEAHKQQPSLQTISAFEINTCDHANIRAQLESVNKEISLLNSQISNMKLANEGEQPSGTYNQTLQPKALHQSLVEASLMDCSEKSPEMTVTNVSLPSPANQRCHARDSSQLKNFEKQVDSVSEQKAQVLEQSVQLNNRRNTKFGNLNSHRVTCAMEIEHIYETIPEDSDTDTYYCSPFDEHKDRSRIEQWLKSQELVEQTLGLTSKSQTSATLGPQRPNNNLTRTVEQELNFVFANPTRNFKHNSIFDDYENSSSAYNTGDSCTSNLLTIEQKLDDKNQSSSTLTYQPYNLQSDIHDCGQCKLRHRRYKETMKNVRKLYKEGEVQDTSQKKKFQPLLQPTAAMLNPYGTTNSNKKSTKLHKKLLRKVVTNAHSNNREINDATVTTTISQPKLSNKSEFPEMKIEQQPHNQPAELSTKFQPDTFESFPMVWKVKRRADGTRYIVRRPIKTNNQHRQKPESHQLNETERNEVICTVGGGVLIKDEIMTLTETRKVSRNNQNSTAIQKYRKKTRDSRHSSQHEEKINKLTETTCSDNMISASRCSHIQKKWLV